MTAVAGRLIVYISRSRAVARTPSLSLPRLRGRVGWGSGGFQEGPMLQEFKAFALKGSVVDLAVGVIIGAAFGAIVTSLVGDIIMPAIGAIGGLDFSNYFLPLSKSVTAPALADAKKQGAVLAWGNFITVCINFLLIAWVIFLAVKGMNRLRIHEDPKPSPPP